jgi:hypothetical protein
MKSLRPHQNAQLCVLSKTMGPLQQELATPRDFGCRIQCGVEVTELSTNKQHTLSKQLSDLESCVKDLGVEEAGKPNCSPASTDLRRDWADAC